MRPPTKKTIFRIALGLAALIAATGVLCLDGLDHQPYFQSAYYTETTARLREREATNTLSRGELGAGFGRALLTPTINAAQDDAAQGRFRAVPLAGFGNRKGRPATGVHDDLQVKAVALRVGDKLGVMVGADALIVPRPVAEAALQRLGEELGLRREQVYLSATHTHCGPGGWGEGRVAEAFAGPFNPGAQTWFADRIVAAVREAVADLRPAALGHGHFAAPEFVRNRLVGALGKVDPEFSFVVLRQSPGRTAVLGSYSAHATVLSSGTMEFSGDYPGSWQRAVEEATGGTALFLAGGVGSHSPVAGEKGFAGVEKMGRALAQRLLEVLPRTPLTNFVAFGTAGLEVTLPSLHVRVSDGVRMRPWLAGKLLPVAERSYLQVFRVGDAVWISTPCDFSGELALGIKDLLRARGFNGVVTSFNGDYLGYVIPARYYHLSGYEPRLMSFCGPNLPDYFDELMWAMALSLAAR
ncbi:MAG TPA: neutral/alkaline non-lysosomal ceramidase N-terminal domain-containing protein [Verrucomicrobiae bacterium]